MPKGIQRVVCINECKVFDGYKEAANYYGLEPKDVLASCRYELEYAGYYENGEGVGFMYETDYIATLRELNEFEPEHNIQYTRHKRKVGDRFVFTIETRNVPVLAANRNNLNK